MINFAPSLGSTRRRSFSRFFLEYLLGDDILVAPVVEEGATSRDIYLPSGWWRDEADPEHPVIQGPVTLTGYEADLFTLPYFTRLSAE